METAFRRRPAWYCLGACWYSALMEPVTAFWLDVVRTVAIVAALLVSVASFVVAIRAQRIALRQEARRTPLLVPYYVEGFIRYLPDGGRAYAFLLSVSNPTDTNNSVAAVDLAISYRQGPGEVALKLSVNAEAKQHFAASSATPLVIPVTIDAHKTVAGWCFFWLGGAALRDHTIESHQIVIVDTHGVEALLRPIVIPEYQDETAKKEMDVGAR
jgi:hypothetical protein